MEHDIINAIDITQQPLIQGAPFQDSTPATIGEHDTLAAEEKEEDQ